MIGLKVSDKLKSLIKVVLMCFRKVIGFLTRHCSLRSGQGHCPLITIMGIKNDSTCRSCYDDKKTPVYILCECEPHSTFRFEHLDWHLLKPWELNDISVCCLLNFTSTTSLFQVSGLEIILQIPDRSAGFIQSHTNTIHSF